MTLEFFGQVVAFLLTLCVFSYFIGDNPFYRLAIHAFLGVAAAYITIVTLQSVLIPQLKTMFEAVMAAEWTTLIILAVPWSLAILLFLKTSPSLAPIGNIAIAVMVGVGAALAVGGAILGTLIPQVQASWSDAVGFNIVLWFFSISGTVTVLLYFLYLGRSTPSGRGQRHPLTVPVAWVGQGFLSIALAALYAGAVAAYFAIFVERIDFIRNFFVTLIGFFGL